MASALSLFPSACFRSCKPGQLLLTAEELAAWAQLVQRDVRFSPFFMQVKVLLSPGANVVEERTARNCGGLGGRPSAAGPGRPRAARLPAGLADLISPLLGQSPQPAGVNEEEARPRNFTRSMARVAEEEKEAAGKVHLDSTLTGKPVDRVGLRHVAQTFKLECLEVVEAISEEHRDMALKLHLSKGIFAKEERLVEWRVFQGDMENCQCRTWILAQPEPEAPKELLQGFGNQSSNDASEPKWPSDSDIASKVAAAVTVRINRYKGGDGRWAQILNMSTGQERCGFGTMLVAGVEALLKSEDVDVVLLYPAQNGSAPHFWTSLGYGANKISLLPKVELIPFHKGGPLIPEMEGSSGELLPRWEKRIAPPHHVKNRRSGLLTIPLAPSRALGGQGGASEERHEVHAPFRSTALRSVQPCDSRLGIGPLQQLYEVARTEQRHRWAGVHSPARAAKRARLRTVWPSSLSSG